jgi:phosphatidylinositol kinase/protein kinase (PI-3  family)
MRALESHSIDVTFFYVPQIVQTLRYDALGYAERYIVETAKFSQLFAHQIIWNMKANAFKDEDSQIVGLNSNIRYCNVNIKCSRMPLSPLLTKLRIE